MSTGSVVYALMALGIVGLGSDTAISQGRTEGTQAEINGDRAARPGTLSWRARTAKANGKDRLSLREPEGFPPVVTSLDQALADYSVLLVQPVATQTVVDDSRIYTWYKGKVVDAFSKRPPAPVELSLDKLPKEMIPQQLLPLLRDEVLVLRHGGTVTVEQVTITSADPRFPDFSLFQKYLLFLSLDSSGKVAFLPMGVDGAFKLAALGNRLEPIHASEHPVQDDIANLFGGSFDRFRQRVSPQRKEGVR